MLDDANQALGYLEDLFLDSIGEACFIDRAGPENARMVRGERATLEDLSPDESGSGLLRADLRPRPQRGLPGPAL